MKKIKPQKAWAIFHDEEGFIFRSFEHGFCIFDSPQDAVNFKANWAPYHGIVKKVIIDVAIEMKSK